ncbi:MAG: DUF3592 domain-containing protein [Alphaproteobacteria bacterium]|nr:MAG: DUF3592 domain-containing protein [Alphaproteobacteria bacterium]
MDSIGYLGIFVALVGLAGALWSALAHSRARSRSQAAERWPTAAGRVTDIDIQLRNGGAGRSHHSYYVPAIRYVYSVNGREREGRTIRFGMPATTTRGAAEAILAPYPVGSTPQVRYNPENPEESVLEHRKIGKNLIGSAIVCALIFAVGVAIVIMAVRGTFSADTDGRWHARFQIDGVVYEGDLEVRRNRGPLTVTYNGERGQSRAVEQCTLRREGQRVTIGCRDPRLLAGEGTYSPDNFDLSFANANTLQGSITSQDGASAGSAIFVRR